MCVRVISHSACWVACFISECCEDTFYSHGEVKPSHTLVLQLAIYRISSNYSATLIQAPLIQFNFTLAPIERQLKIVIIFSWRLAN